MSQLEPPLVVAHSQLFTLLRLLWNLSFEKKAGSQLLLHPINSIPFPLFQGLEKVWPSLACLVLHLTVMPEMLPCPLRLPKASTNPAFTPCDLGHGEELTPLNGATHFRPISDPSAGRCGGGGGPFSPSTSANGAGLTAVAEEDEDYQRLSDFSSIMADLKLRPHSEQQSMLRKSGAHRKR